MLTLNDLSKDQIGFLLLLDQLAKRGQALKNERISYLAQIKLPGVADNYGEIFQSLQKMDLFHGGEEIILTGQGADLVQQAGREHSLVGWFYDEYYQAVQHSKAHSIFCERVYGLDLAQHGMADMDQLEILIGELRLEPGMRLLDFGCGDGRITEHLAHTTQTKISGVDKSNTAIQLANQRTVNNREQLDFYWADIEKGAGRLPQGSFDRIFAIDSIMFVQDIDRVISSLFGLLSENGVLGVLMICPPQTTPDETHVGKTLQSQGRTFRVQDLSDLNRAHWTLKNEVLLELEEDFKQEGSSFLFNNRLAECQSNLEDLQRYLYIIPQ